MPPTYCFHDDAMQEDAVDSELGAALSEDKVREMALRAAGLSDRAPKAITHMTNSARDVKGLKSDSPAEGQACLTPGRRRSGRLTDFINISLNDLGINN